MSGTGTRAVISGTGLYAPGPAIENSFFSEKYAREMDVFLRGQRGISTRHFMVPEQATSDLALPAAREAMANAGVTAADLDLIIVATDTPDFLSPSTASVVQYKLGAVRAGTFDLNSACAGFVTALDIAAKYIASDVNYENILVVGAYGMSKFFDWNDYKVTSVFADGAGAVILQRAVSPEFGLLAAKLTTLGEYHGHMGIYAGGTRTPISDSAIRERAHLLKFAKRIPAELNVEQWPQLTNTILGRIGASVADVNHFFFTQINIQSINEAMTRIGAPLAKAHNVMDRFGYTGSACIPMALADAAKASQLRKGDLVLCLASGGGVSLAAAALRWSFNT